MRIGMDFDGTLAVWPRGVPVDYSDPDLARNRVAANVVMACWVKRQRQLGHDVIVITGRGSNHALPVARWLRIIFDDSIKVVARPHHVGLATAQQATWKAAEMVNRGIGMFVGDNPDIDRAAAALASVPYLDAAHIHQGYLPTVKDTVDAFMARADPKPSSRAANAQP